MGQARGQFARSKKVVFDVSARAPPTLKGQTFRSSECDFGHRQDRTLARVARYKAQSVPRRNLRRAAPEDSSGHAVMSYKVIQCKLSTSWKISNTVPEEIWSGMGPVANKFRTVGLEGKPSGTLFPAFSPC